MCYKGHANLRRYACCLKFSICENLEVDWIPIRKRKLLQKIKENETGKRRLLEGKVLNSFTFTIKETVHISFFPSYLWYSDGGVVRNASLYLFGTYRASELGWKCQRRNYQHLFSSSRSIENIIMLPVSLHRAQASKVSRTSLW